MTTRTAIGVDLGATNVVVSWVNSRGETEILLNMEGQASTPATVCLADDRTIVDVGECGFGGQLLLAICAHADSRCGEVEQMPIFLGPETTVPAYAGTVFISNQQEEYLLLLGSLLLAAFLLC